MGLSRKKKVSQFLIYVVLVSGSVLMVIPFLWMVLTSFKTYKETIALPIQWFPSQWNFDNYAQVLGKLDFLRYYRNTILVTITTVAVMTFLAALAASVFLFCACGYGCRGQD